MHIQLRVMFCVCIIIWCAFRECFASASNVRLVGGATEYEGRLEVFYNGSWGTVCDDYSNDKLSAVVCQSLGLPWNTSETFCCAAYGQGSGPIWLDDIICEGSETAIEECKHSDWGSHNCGHDEDLSINCFPNNDTAVRLVDGKTEYEGRLEVYKLGRWGTVCGDNVNNKLAAVVCRSLGFPWNTSEAYSYGKSGPIWLDDVQCLGSETGIEECRHKAWGSHTCNDGNAAYIDCLPDNIAVRLVGGATKYDGRLQVYKFRRWITVCGDNGNNKLAAVVCRSLGSPWNTSEASRISFYGSGWNEIRAEVKCQGSEANIEECTQSAWGYHACSRWSVVSINCSPNNGTSLRLVGGETEYEGRLEIYRFGRWGTVCGDYVNDNLAAVVCRSLDFPWNTSEAYGGAVYGTGSGSILLDDVKCFGTERRIEDCRHNEWGLTNCGHDNDVSINCLPSNDTAVRLVGGDTEYEGRLEVYKFGKWGTVCDTNLNNKLAVVVCRSLGFPWNTSEAYGRDVYGKPSSHVWLDHVECDGSENRIDDCRHSAWGSNNCYSEYHHVSINCLPSNDVRLVGGATKYEGQVELYKFGKWINVCSDDLNAKLAAVVCRSLGFPWNTSEAYGGAIYGHRSNSVWWNIVNCVGTESRIEECRRRNWKYQNCNNGHHLSINCLPLNDTAVRLGRGATKYDGQLEVYKSGKWGSVCDPFVNDQLAVVVCRSLGFPWNSSEAYGNGNYGGIYGPVWLNYVKCKGTETSIEECSHSAWGTYKCDNHIYISCLPSKDIAVRLRGGANKYQGRLEVYKSGKWGTVCDNHLNDKLAVVVCRSLGFPWNTSEAYKGSLYGMGEGPIWLDDVQCLGSETRIDECRHRAWGSNKCNHGMDVSINCLPSEDIPVRLVGGATEFEGQLEVYKSGIWGRVCDNNLNEKLAAVVCRSLGLPWNFTEIYSDNVYGQWSAPIWFDGFDCVGSETRIEECRRNVTVSEHCGKHVSINCLPSKYTDVRLVGGATKYEGRLEVYKFGRWGVVCGGNSNNKVATVVCRSLGLPWNTSEVYNGDEYGRRRSGPIWLDAVNCDGSEKGIDECSKSAWGSKNCWNYYALSINCLPSNDTAVRLVGGSTEYEGQLEVYKLGRWGTVCDNYLNNNMAAVVCRSLGFPWDTSEAYGGSIYVYYSWLNYVICDGSEKKLEDCRHSVWGYHRCNKGHTVFINCLPQKDIAVSLIGGANKYEGRLQVYKSGKWGTVCDTNLNDKLAAVVCRSLGFPWNTSEAYGGAIYGKGQGRIWLDGVDCVGTEKGIEKCRHSTWGSNNCTHDNDVYINCFPSKDSSNQLCKRTSSEKIERTRDLSYDDHMQQLLQVETQKMNIAKENLDIEKKRLAMDEQRLALDQRRFRMQLQRHQIYLAKNRVTRSVADQNV